MKNQFVEELRQGISNFKIIDRWRARHISGKVLLFSEIPKHPELSSFVDVVKSEKSFSIFDDFKIHMIGNSGAPFTREHLAEWAIKRSLITDPLSVANDIWRYKSSSSVPGYQVLFVDGLYVESSDDIVNFTNDVRIVPMERAPFEGLRALAYENSLFHDIKAILCQPIRIKKSIISQNSESGSDITQFLPNFDDLEDRVQLLSLVANQGFQIAASAYVPDDCVPTKNGVGYSAHSRRAPVKMAPPIIGLHTSHAEELFSLFKKFPGKQKRQLRVPLRKLNDHMSEVSEPQSATDLRTCLESLFLDNNKEREYRYRLALRAACL